MIWKLKFSIHCIHRTYRAVAGWPHHTLRKTLRFYSFSFCCKETEKIETFYSNWWCLSSSALHGLGNIRISIKDFIILILWKWVERTQIIYLFHNNVVQRALCDAADTFIIILIVQIKKQCLFTCNDVLKIVFCWMPFRLLLPS